MKRLAGKTAVITGAGSGIGRALALELTARGADVAVSDIDRAAAADTAAECDRRGGRAVAYRLDVSDRDAVLAHADDVAGDFGRVNLLINNAGVALLAPVAEMSLADLDWIMGINYWGVVHGTKAFLGHLTDSGEGHVVNVSSVLGLIGAPTQSGYSSAKFAVRGFTEALRQEMLIERRPVGVTCVHPGGVRTNIVRSARADEAWRPGPLTGLFDRVAMTTPERAARTILRAVERDRARVLVGPDAYAVDAIPRLLGAGYQRIAATGVRAASRLGVRIGRY